jgi:hypothetical protein
VIGEAQMPGKTTAATFTAIIRRQLTATIEMLGEAIESCPDEWWTLSDENAPVWEQLYHAVFWLNAWARDWSIPFERPAFHSDKALELEHGASPVVTKEQMRVYLNKARTQCMSFIDSLSDDALVAEQEAFGRRFTPADRLVGQISHAQHHVGIIYALIMEATGEYPRWIESNWEVTP